MPLNHIEASWLCRIAVWTSDETLLLVASMPAGADAVPAEAGSAELWTELRLSWEASPDHTASATIAGV